VSKQVMPFLDRPLDGAPKVALFDPAVSAADFAATEPDSRNLQACLA
jgi:hypothetical protein